MKILYMLFFEKIYTKIFITIEKLRIARLRSGGARVGNNVKLYGRYRVIGDYTNLDIDDGTTINEGVVLNCSGAVKIGKKVRLSSYVQIHSGALHITQKDKTHWFADIVICDNVWIASGAVISPGVRIGKNSIVCANAVVTDSVPDNTVVGGVPAHVIGSLTAKLRDEFE